MDISVQGTRACVLLMDGNWTESTCYWQSGRKVIRRRTNSQETWKRRWNAPGRKWWSDKAGKKDSVRVIQATVAPRSATDRPDHS